MADETATRGREALLCPACGSTLNVECLVVEDNHGDDEVYMFDCPTDDFRRTATRAQLLEAAASAVVASVWQEWWQPSAGESDDQRYSS